MLADVFNVICEDLGACFFGSGGRSFTVFGRQSVGVIRLVCLAASRDSLAAWRGFGRCDGGLRAGGGFLAERSWARESKGGSFECSVCGIREKKVLGMLWCANMVPTEIWELKRRRDKYGGEPAVVRRLARWAGVEEVAIDVRDGAGVKWAVREGFLEGSRHGRSSVRAESA
jgi:hypothetical protein